MPNDQPKTRIQRRNTRAILDAALDVFSKHGFRGATVDQIAQAAGLSKPNLLYYFPSKEAMHIALMNELLDTWLDPMRALDPDGDPVEELLNYALRKLDMARDLPRESRLFANEIVQGAPRTSDTINGPLKALVDEKAAMINAWVADNRLAPVDGHHLIFSIWATTQHYADFDVQVRGILGAGIDDQATFENAQSAVRRMILRMLTPTDSDPAR